MGCDIHLHIEVKIKGVWHHYGSPRVGRNYRLFGKMAGVRDEEEIPISLPKGLPKDLTVLTQFDALNWQDDGHSHSWLDKKEIAELSDWWEASDMNHIGFEWDCLNCYMFGHEFASLHKWPGELDVEEQGLEDVRFVFWFDN